MAHLEADFPCQRVTTLANSNKRGRIGTIKHSTPLFLLPSKENSVKKKVRAKERRSLERARKREREREFSEICVRLESE